MHPIVLQVCLLDQHTEALPGRRVPDVPSARRRVSHDMIPGVVQVLALVHREHDHCEPWVLEYTLGEAQRIMGNIRAQIEIRQREVREVREERMRDIRADAHILQSEMRYVVQEQAAVRDAQTEEDMPFIAVGMADERRLVKAGEERKRTLAWPAGVPIDRLADHVERPERVRGECKVLDAGARAEDVHLTHGRCDADGLGPECADVLAEVRGRRAP